MRCDNPLVSIITPLFNSEMFVKLTIESVLNQSYSNWEMIIVDDCSIDDSIKIVESFKKNDPRIVLIESKTNSGPGVSRNMAIDYAKGEIIAFLDSDDIWHPNKLELHVSFMLENNAAFSHTSYGFIDEEGKSINQTFHVSSQPVDYLSALKRTEISCLTAMYNVKLIGKHYMPDLRRKQDYALWLSILKQGNKSIPFDKELAYYRQRKGSVTNKKYKLIIGHYMFLKQQEGLNSIEAFKYTLLWMYNGLLKYYLKK